MASGITYPIVKGEDLTLSGFATRAAHAFAGGPTSEPIWTTPDRSDVDHYEERLVEVEAELEAAKALTEGQAFVQADLSFHTQVQRREEIIAQNERLRERVAQMRPKVEQWEVPDKLDFLKHFMIEELDRILERDVVGQEFIDAYYTPRRLTPQEYIADQIERCEDNLEATREYLKRAQERYEENLAWLQAFHEAVKELDS